MLLIVFGTASLDGALYLVMWFSGLFELSTAPSPIQPIHWFEEWYRKGCHYGCGDQVAEIPAAYLKKADEEKNTFLRPETLAQKERGGHQTRKSRNLANCRKNPCIPFS